MPNKENKPNFFIVGAPKCGTTSMHDYLSQHPEIFMSEPKEPRYFCRDFHEEADSHGSSSFFPIRERSAYTDIFSGVENEKVIGEATPIYLFSEVAAANIHDFNPEAEIIIHLRDPVTFCYSWYYQLVQIGHETAPSFERALQLEPQRKKLKQIPGNRGHPSEYLYTEWASFAQHIKRFKKFFPAEQIHFVLLDEIKRDTQKAYEGVLEFLDVNNTEFEPDFSVQSPGVTPRSIWINNLVKNPGQKIESKIKYILPKQTIKYILGMFNDVMLTKRDNTKMAKKTRQVLKKQFADEVTEIDELVDKNILAEWEYENLIKNT
jgi:hypothetical protein